MKIKEYLDPVTHDQADAALRLNSDILSDNCPDILDISELDLKALASKGLFADLNSFLENSSLLNASDFPDNLLGAYTVDNKLITIPSCFSLKTVFGWSEATGGTWGWSLCHYRKISSEKRRLGFYRKTPDLRRQGFRLLSLAEVPTGGEGRRCRKHGGSRR